MTPLDALIDSSLDLAPHPNRVSQNLVSRNPQDFVPSFGQMLVTAPIMLAAFVGLMIITIDLTSAIIVVAVMTFAAVLCGGPHAGRAPAKIGTIVKVSLGILTIRPKWQILHHRS